ncbi:hypothetical protein Ac2012v2_007724 [Leucoagaricus gongylophorus]
MTSLTKAAYGAKMRRQSAPPPLPPSPPPSPHPILTYRTELKVQEIPPQLCHLTGDELAMPFPPIALGGYIRYYRAHPEHPESFNIWEQGLEKFDFQVTNSIQEVKKRRRASASTSLGSLPESSPLTKIPPRSNLFHTPTSSSSPESISLGPPLLPRRPILPIIHEDSRETMRSEMKENISLPTTPRKARVASCPPAVSTTSTNTTTSALTLSLAVSPSPGYSSPLNPSVKSNSPAGATQSAPLSRSRGSLKRKKRRILRTPSVENDFARSAKELFGFTKNEYHPDPISRANSTASEITEEGEDPIPSPTVSLSTALTSILDTQSISSSSSSSPPSSPPSSPSSPSSPTKLGKKPKNNNSPISIFLDHHHDSSDSDGSSSPIISTPPGSFTGSKGLLNTADLPQFVFLDFDEDEAREEGGESRDSWASYVTAKSYLEPSLPVVLEAD